jgi:TonB-linked SusC/RagA family outer membrane protein
MQFFTNGAPPCRKADEGGLPLAAPVTKTKDRKTCKTLLFRAMKLTGIILLVACIHVSARTNAQRIAISVKNVPLQKLFLEIERKTNYTFFYDVTILKDSKPVTLEMRDASVEEILKIALANQNQLAFSITDKTIFVKKEKKVVAEEIPEGGGPGGSLKAKGIVYNEAGVPIAGANVTIKQTEKGTITNAKGEFELSTAPVGGVLIVSFVGYAPQEIKVKDASIVRVYLKVTTNELDKAVVQAYGTTSQRLTTSDIGTVTAEEIERQPVMNPLLALQGKIAGLDVVETNGYASAPVKVELRGRAAINPIFTSDPLYIIDGVPLTVNEVTGYSSYQSGSVGFDQLLMSPAGGQSPFFSINPSDIESIEVLKDADATAIYGSRGANGVILITTKRGKAGKTKFDLNLQDGTTQVDRFWDMLNTTQYLAMRREALYNVGTPPDPINDYDINGIWDTARYTNWQKVLYGGIGRATNAQASLSGGDARSTFRMSVGYNRTTGITTVSGADQRANLSLNFMHRSLDQRLNISSSSSYSYTESNLISLPGNVSMAPDAPAIYDSLGNLNWVGWAGKAGSSTVAERQYAFGGLKQPYTGKTNFLNTNLVIGYELIRGLQASVSFGYNVGQSNQVSVNPIASQNPLFNPQGTLSLGNSLNTNWIVEPQATYTATISKGKLTILAGASSSQNNTNAVQVIGTGYLSDLLINSIASAPSIVASNYTGDYRYFGGFARATYNWENKYLVNLNARRDGSSRFGPGKQYGNFGSVGGAWIASEEPWMKNVLPSFVSLFKLRGSYGITGSDAVPNYSYLSQYSSSSRLQPYDGQSTLLPVINPNPNFRWQSNKKLEGAINLGLLQDRVDIQAAWYRDRTGNQLVPFPTPLFTGFGSVIENSPALVQNSGWEFTTSANLVKTNKFNWTVNFNIAINRNKLVAYPNFSQSPFTALLKVGQPLNISNVLHYTGVDPQTGLYTYLDKNHDGQINWNPGQVNDDSYPLVLAPKFFGGVGMNFSYASLNVSFFFNYKNQKGQNSYFYTASGSPGNVNVNQPAAILGKQWQYPGDDQATIAKFTPTALYSNNLFARSDGTFTDASFFRLSNLSVSYGLPSYYLKKVGVQGCSLFFHTNNLFIITKYKGLDPETQNFGELPPVKIIVGGINFTF